MAQDLPPGGLDKVRDLVAWMRKHLPEYAAFCNENPIFKGRLSGVVDIPNACCSLYLPTAIFDFDVTPSAAGPTFVDRGEAAVSS